MIDLANILAHLPKNKIKDLETITQRIVDTRKAEIVVLFGSYARGNYKEQRGVDKGKKSDYDILIVTSNNDTKKEIKSKLRGVFEDIGIPVQLIAEHIDYVNSNLEETQYFFTDIKREGKVLYNSKEFKLSDSKELNATQRREIAEGDFKMWFNQAKDFYWGFENYFKANKNQLASFHLQ